MLKIPRDEIKVMLQKWGFLSEAQLQTLNFHQLKDNISQEVVQLCEVNLLLQNMSVTYGMHEKRHEKNPETLINTTSNGTLKSGKCKAELIK